MRIALRQHPIIAITVIIIIVLLIWGFNPQPIVVEAIAVKRGPITITIEEEGRSRVIDRYIISAPVDGVACRLHLKVGDDVEQGQVLLSITPLASKVLDQRSRAQAQAKVFAAESTLHSAEEQARAADAASKLADNELKRLRPLVDKGLVARETFDKAATEAKTSIANKRSADFNVDVAKYELQAAQTILEYAADSDDEPAERVPVLSPITGKILKVQRQCKGPVRTGESLLEVGDPSALEVEVDVLSSDAVKIKQGMKVQFDRWGGEQSLEGIVRIIEPVGFTKTSALGVEEQRVLIISDFTSPQSLWQRIGDGYRIEAKFILWQQDDVLQVPASSLFRYQDGWAIFVIKDGRAERRNVDVGQRNGLIAQILSGVAEGEMIINHPADDVAHQRKVTQR